MIKKIGFVVLGVFIVLQFITIDKTNPSVKYDLIVNNPDVKSILKKACYDCHSNETVWPWYSSIAPVSWQIEEDVLEARKELNFSDFEDYSKKRKIHKLEEMKEEMEEGKMPEDAYVFMHSEADLSDAEKNEVYQWISAKISEIKSDTITNNLP